MRKWRIWKRSWFVIGVAAAYMASTVGVQAHASRRRSSVSSVFNQRTCLNSRCTVFVNNPFVNSLFINNSVFNHSFGNNHFFPSRFSVGLNSLALGSLLSNHGLGFNRFSSLGHLGGFNSLSGLGGFGHNGFGHGGFGYGSLAASLLANDLHNRSLLGLDGFYGNRFPNFGLNNFFRNNDIGSLDPIAIASPFYTFKPQPLAPNAREYTPPATVTPDISKADPALHGGNSENSLGDRPVLADASLLTPVDPVSSLQRLNSETFPLDSKDWRLTALADIIRQLPEGASARGTMNPQLCTRAIDQSRALANENFLRRNQGLGLAARHIGEVSLAQITAVTSAQSASAAIQGCINQWLGSESNLARLQHAYKEYCYAVIPVGDVYACTGVFQ